MKNENDGCSFTGCIFGIAVVIGGAVLLLAMAESCSHSKTSTAATEKLLGLAMGACF